MGKKDERFTAEETLQYMSAPGMDGVYVLNCGLEPRMTVRSQQVRALSLVGGLFATRRLHAGSSVAIVGGGVGGTTAAAIALQLGASVRVLERLDDVLLHYRNSRRYIDPSLFDWPQPHCRDPRSNLPILSWGAGPGSEVMSKIAAQWKGWQQLFARRLSVECNVDWVRLDAGLPIASHDSSRDRRIRPELRWTTSTTTSSGRFDAVILAVGFGSEKNQVPHRETGDHRTYLQDRKFGSKRPLVIVGTGDGAMGEVIAHAFCWRGKQLQEDQVRKLIGYKDSRPGETRDQDAGVEGVVATFKSRIRKLMSEGKLVPIESGALVLAMRISEDDRKSDSDALSIEKKKLDRCFPINKAFLEILREKRLVEIIHINDASSIRWNGSEFVVPVASNNCRHFPGLVERTGPDRALERSFPDVWKSFELAGRLKEIRKRGIDTGARLAVAETMPENSGDPRLLYSDLFDSVTQREVFEAIVGRNWDGRFENEKQPDGVTRFVALYFNVLKRRIKAGFSWCFPDNQTLDGLFFQALASLRFDAEWKALEDWIRQKRVVLRLRRSSVDEQLDHLVCKRRHEFSSLPGGSKTPWRVRLRDQMDGELSDWREFGKQSFASKALQLQVSRLCKRIDGLRQKLRSVDIAPHRNTTFPLEPSFEDPGDFVRRCRTFHGKELAVRAFHEANRTAVYAMLDKALADNASSRGRRRRYRVAQDLREIRAWYFRAYNLAMARHHGAVASEATYLSAAHWWTRASAEPRQSQPTASFEFGEAKRSSSVQAKRSSAAPNDSDLRVQNIVNGLTFGVAQVAPVLKVPDARAPGIYVPYAVELLSPRSGRPASVSKEGESEDPLSRAFSLIEHLVEPRSGP